MSISIDELREMYSEERETSKALRGVIDRQDKRIDRLINDNNRLGDELRSARNDNERTRSVGEGMQSSENDKESQRERLDAANASIKEIQHSKKKLDQELRTERRRNAQLQVSLKQAQDAKAELEHSLQEMQYAWHEGDRIIASGYAERSQKLEKRFAEKEKSLQEWEERLQEKEQSLQQNQRSSSGAVGHINTEPLAQPNLKLNPGAIAFRPTDSKSMAQVAVESPPPVVSNPKEKDVTMDFIASFLAKVKAEKAAKADAFAKSKTPDNKKIKDAAAGKNLEPGRPKSSDTPPNDAITGKRKFEEDAMFSAQQSGPSRSKLA